MGRAVILVAKVTGGVPCPAPGPALALIGILDIGNAIVLGPSKSDISEKSERWCVTQSNVLFSGEINFHLVSVTIDGHTSGMPHGRPGYMFGGLSGREQTPFRKRRRLGYLNVLRLGIA